MWQFCVGCKNYKAPWMFSKGNHTPFKLQYYCKDCQHSKNKLYRRTSKEKISARRRVYNRLHKQDIDNYNQEYHRENKQSINKRQRGYRLVNKDKDALRSACRRASKLNQTPKLSVSEERLIALLYEYAKMLGEDFQVDHIVPLSKGGLHHPNNMQILHRVQNLKKKDKSPTDFYG